MKGDILLINENHKKAAQQVVKLILQEIKNHDNKYVVSVAGESGAGKSEVAASIAKELNEKGLDSYVFQQDDYFVYPPKTNAKERKKNISWVGPQEVKLDLIDEELSSVLAGETVIEKPLVIFGENKIDKETVDLKNFKVLIIEGTYTTLLNNINTKVYIDRNYIDTKSSRKERNREDQDDFLEKILQIEHRIISGHKKYADIIITKDFNAVKSHHS